MLVGSGIWNFVILVDQRPIALLEMAKTMANGKYSVPVVLN